jgi:SAM-dependent methyltransferase
MSFREGFIMRLEILDLVVCPACKGKLELMYPTWTSETRFSFGSLVCAGCEKKYTVVDDIAILKEPGWIGWEQYFSALQERTDEWQQWFWKLDDEIRNSYTSDEREGGRRTESGLIAESGVKEADIILDVATGRGLLLRAMCSIMSENALTVASDMEYTYQMGLKWHFRREGFYDKMSFVVCDARRLPFKDDAFGCVVSNAGLSNIREPELAVKEAYRVVRPGYRVAMSLWSVAEGSKSWEKAAEIGIGSLIAPGKAEKCFKEVGFVEVSSEQYHSAVASYQNPYNAIPIKGDWYAYVGVWGKKPAANWKGG